MHAAKLLLTVAHLYNCLYISPVKFHCVLAYWLNKIWQFSVWLLSDGAYLLRCTFSKSQEHLWAGFPSSFFSPHFLSPLSWSNARLFENLLPELILSIFIYPGIFQRPRDFYPRIGKLPKPLLFLHIIFTVLIFKSIFLGCGFSICKNMDGLSELPAKTSTKPTQRSSVFTRTGNGELWTRGGSLVWI